jgi:dTDP-4-amino-4,6-dideoxygalactose transaminase
MDPILEFANQHSLWVVEDCAQAHGATYKGRRVGSIAHVAAFSFCQDKIISTGGEGGMVVTNDSTLWERMWSYKDHGRDYGLSHAPAGPGFRWIHNSVGTNFRLTEMQSAIGRIQLRTLDEQLAIRRRNASLLNAGLFDIAGLRLTLPPSDIGHAYYKYYAFVDGNEFASGWDRDRILAAICAEGISCSQGSCSEIYLEQAFPPEMRPPLRLESARRLGETSLMLVVHPTLTTEDMQDTCRAVRKVFESAIVSPRVLAAA